MTPREIAERIVDRDWPSNCLIEGWLDPEVIISLIENAIEEERMKNES
jgi:hypothetical protein